MSFLSDFFDSLSGADSNNTSAQTNQPGTHPCSNCPSNCAIAGDACKVCSPYKKKLIDAIYYIDHLDEFKAQYEVTGLSGAASTITCPYCGAQTQNHQVCEYCGSKLSEGSGKVKVSSASEIPNPVMQAQDIIFERYEAVVKQYAPTSSGSGKGLLDGLFSAIAGDSDNDDDSRLGAKMSESEIREAASLYGVSIGEYLTGLDNGKYLTLAGRKAAASQNRSDDFTPNAAGFAGVAGIGAFAGLLLGNSAHHRRPYYYSQPHHHTPPRRDQQRPDRYSASMPSHHGPGSPDSFDPGRRDHSSPNRHSTSHSDRRGDGPGRNPGGRDRRH